MTCAPPVAREAWLKHIKAAYSPEPAFAYIADEWIKHVPGASAEKRAELAAAFENGDMRLVKKERLLIQGEIWLRQHQPASDFTHEELVEIGRGFMKALLSLADASKYEDYMRFFIAYDYSNIAMDMVASHEEGEEGDEGEEAFEPAAKKAKVEENVKEDGKAEEEYNERLGDLVAMGGTRRA